MYSYIWIEGEKNLNEFCMKRFGEKPRFMETIGRVSGKGAAAKVHMINKHLTDDELADPNRTISYHDMYFLYMEHNDGKYYQSEIQEIMRWPYEKIRTDKAAILRKRG